MPLTTNDIPELSGATAPESPTAEDLVASAQIVSTSGSLTAIDADAGDTLTPLVVGNASAVYNGSDPVPLDDAVDLLPLIDSGAIAFLLDSTDGDERTFTWTYTPAAADLDWLREGDTLTLTFRAFVGDGTTTVGEEDLVITITGTNDAPTIDAITTPVAYVEDGNATSQDLAAVTGTITVSDADLGDTLTVSIDTVVASHEGGAVPAGADVSDLIDPAALTIGLAQASTGGAVSFAYTYDPVATDLDWLGFGETLSITFNLVVNDGTTTSASQAVTIEIVGTNDAPVITVEGADSDTLGLAETSEGAGDAASGAFAEPTSGTLSFTDRDFSDNHTLTVEGVSTGGTNPTPPTALDFLSMLSASISQQTGTDGTGGEIAYSFLGVENDFDYLDSGEDIVLTYTLRVTDDATGAFDEHLVTVTIDGADDTPDAVDDVADIAEDPASVVVEAIATGNVLDNDSDPDETDELGTGVTVIAAAVGAVTPVAFTTQAVLNGTNGDLTLQDDGSWSYAYLNTDAIIAGEIPLVDTFTYEISDGDGTTDTATLTINISGSDLDLTIHASPFTGQRGDDVLLGTAAADEISGADGDDDISGLGAGDTLYGNAGDDTLRGGAGSDTAYGGADDDTLLGGDDADELWGGLGDLSAGSGNDHISGGDGDDEIHGEDGNDLLEGDAGNDEIHGEDGNDVIHGGADVDLILGGDGNDVIYGGDGDDLVNPVGPFSGGLYGNDGDDVIFGGAGSDTLVGGNGQPAEGSGEAYVPDYGNDVLYGGAGDDFMWGEDGDDIIWGGAGNDQYAGGAGSDVLYLDGDGEADDGIWGGLYGATTGDLFVLLPNFGTDTIQDFKNIATIAQDRINVAHMGITTWSDLNSLITTDGGSSGDATITFTTGEVLIIKGIVFSNLDADDFVFALDTNIDQTGLTVVDVPDAIAFAPPIGVAATPPSGTSATVSEDTPVGTSIGALSTTDTDSSSFTYQLIENPGGYFAIGGAGFDELVLAADLDYETLYATNYDIGEDAVLIDISVRVSDADHNIHEETFTITVGNDAPSAPADSNANANEVAEGASAGTTVGIIATSTDVHGPDVVWSLSGANADLFDIDSDGIVTVAGTIDYEGEVDHTYDITLVASDGYETSTTDVTVSILNVAPTSPIDTDGDANAIVEGALEGAGVGIDVASTDVNGGTVSYALSGADAHLFAIDGNGVVTVSAAGESGIDYESASGHTYTITVEATDGTDTTTADFSIAVINAAAEPITDADGSDGGSVAEGATNDTYVGITAAATDPNGGTVTFALAAGGDAGGRFKINAVTGQVSVADGSLIDYETATSHTITVETSDGTDTATQDFTVTVENAAPAPLGDADAADNRVTEGDPASTPVGFTATAVDPNGLNGGSITYAFAPGGNPGDVFAIDGSSGIITVDDASGIDYETAPRMQVIVRASDTDGGYTDTPLWIDVANAAPGAITDDNATSLTYTDRDDGEVTADGVIAEGGTGTVGLTATATDVNGGTLTYSLTDDAGGRFRIDALTGIVTVADETLLNFEDDDSHAITIEVSDGTDTTTETFRIAVTNELPSDPVDSDVPVEFLSSVPSETGETADGTITEGATGNVGITAYSTDINGPAVTYTLADAASSPFQIHATSGVVSVRDASLVDYESATDHQYQITVLASDGFESSEQTFVIDVTNVAPSTPTDIDTDGYAFTDRDDGAITADGSVDEGAAIGTLVDVEADSTDVNGPAVVYSLQDAGSSPFQIDSATGVVSVRDPALLDFETADSHDITVIATDGTASSQQTFTIAVKNVAPSTPVDNDTDGYEYDDRDVEGSEITTADGYVVEATATVLAFQASSTDPQGPVVTWSLVNGGSLPFEIASDGTLTVKSGETFDYETGPDSYAVSVRSFDGYTYSQTTTFTIAVANAAPSLPSDIDAADNTVEEGAAAGTEVGVQASSSDPLGPAVTYSLSGDDSAFFDIDAVTGIVTVSEAGATGIDYETPPGHAYQITVHASDGTTSSSEDFTIAVTSVVPTDPIDNDDRLNMVADGAETGTYTGVTAASGDVNGGALTYVLTDDAGGLFQIDGATGEVTLVGPVDVAVSTDYTIEIQTTDGALDSAAKQFTVTVINASAIVEQVGGLSLGLDPTGTSYRMFDDSGTDVALTRSLTPYGPASVPQWTAIHAEHDGSGGFNVLWERTNGDLAWWKVGSDGDHDSDTYYPIEIQTTELIEDLELVFDADLNDDTYVGAPPVILESDGDLMLQTQADHYFIRDGATIDVGLSRNGTPYGPDTIAQWEAIHAEEDGSGGFNVLWQRTNGDLAWWMVDATGAYTGDNYYPIGSQTTGLIEDLELVFETDLNDDTYVGAPPVILESDGDLMLQTQAEQYFLRDGADLDIGLTRDGNPYGPGTVPQWEAIQAEEDGSGGYYVLWERTNGDLARWHVNAEGAYQSDDYYPIGSQTTELIEDLELVFDTDLNEDTYIGTPPVVVESNGALMLQTQANQYFIRNDTDVDVGVTRNGNPYGPDTVAQWEAIQTEDDGATGFYVLWERTNGDYARWTVDDTGAYVSDIYYPIGGQTDNDIWGLEEDFDVDLNDDLMIGEPIP